MKDNLSINISTENGTGSQTANKILTRSIVLSGFHANSKNLFPSNIAGLPTQYRIRINSKSFKSFSKSEKLDILVAFNKKTLKEDLKSASDDTLVLINKDFKDFKYKNFQYKNSQNSGNPRSSGSSGSSKDSQYSQYSQGSEDSQYSQGSEDSQYSQYSQGSEDSQYSKGSQYSEDSQGSEDSQKEVNFFYLPCRTLVKELHPSVNIRKLLHNMIYVGATIKALGLDLEFGNIATKYILSHLKDELKEANLKALEAGYFSEFASEFASEFDKPFFSLKKPSKEPNKFMIDGNTAMALGFIDGGAQVFTWYPITPSSSVAETFELIDKKLNLKRAVLQCEDELSAAMTSLGAGWAGAKSLTATSGPGLSLMQESVGLGYFTETPFVIANIQRAGPSTGLPTRTSQGDLLMCYYSSHGDTIHPILFPSNPQEAYSDSFSSLSLAQDLQTPVFVLSDLDLGMNEWSTSKIVQENSKQSVGQIQKNYHENYKRFSNEALISKRSLPRLSHSTTACFTRGSGHDEYGHYSENPDTYEKKLIRLKDKILKGRSISKFFPNDIIKHNIIKNDIIKNDIIKNDIIKQVSTERQVSTS